MVLLYYWCAFAVNVFRSGIDVRKKTYSNVLFAKFNNVDGVQIGSVVKIAGVNVGSVEKIELDEHDFNVKLTMRLQSDLKIPTDSTISVNSDGLLGGKYLGIEP